MSSPIQVYSEIGRLRRVLLHRPGAELENLVPEMEEIQEEMIKIRLIIQNQYKETILASLMILI